VADGIQFAPWFINEYLYLGPGNGASIAALNSQASVAVPVPAGTLSNLNVSVDKAPNPTTGSTVGYTITVCDNSVCTGPSCQILGPNTSCTATGTQTYNDGDTMSLQVQASTSDSEVLNSSNATWSANYTIANP
jgi:hypothetical protein